jgi:hypothetical protein
MHTVNRMLLFTFICIPLRFLIDYILIENNLYYVSFFIGLMLILRMFNRTCTGLFGGERTWSVLSIALHHFIIANLILYKKQELAHIISVYSLLFSLLSHLERSLF